MESYAVDLMTAIAVIMNGIPQALLSLSLGFAAFPTALAFLVGAAGSLAFNSVATISFQAETVAIVGKLGKTPHERLNLIFWGSLFLLIPSLLGLNEKIIAFIGPAVVSAMMAGVGITLAFISVDMVKAEKYSGISSMIVALIVWFVTLDLAKMVIISVAVATVVYNVMRRYGKISAQKLNVDVSREKLTTGNIDFKIWRQPRVLASALAISCLNIGANISFGAITASIANTKANIDHLAIYSTLADMVSAFFGGGPVETIISGTATAPHPLGASVLMMLLMAAILFLKLLPIIGRYVHSSAIAGLLFVLGVFVTFTSNIEAAIATVPAQQGSFGFTPWGMAIGATVLASARWNPFYGLLAGAAIKIIFGL